MQPLRIILFTDADVFAGTERHMLDLAAGLRALGAIVALACPRPGALASRADAAGVPVLEIPKRGYIDHNAISFLAEKLRAGEADILHAHNGRTHIAAAFAVRKARRGACVATQHFLAPARTQRSGPKAWLAHYLHRRASRFTAHTIAISDAVRNAALARGEAMPAAITTVHNGTAPPDLSNASAPAAIRESLGLSPTTPVIFCAARLEPEKDITTLIAAMKHVIISQPTARCFIAGDGARRRALQHQIETLQLQKVVTLLGFRNDVPALLRASDIFALPSLAEPFGLVLLEAMALAKPVIATNTGGPPEIVVDKQTGMLVPPSDPQALAQAIGSLIAGSEQRRSLGEAGARRCSDYFNVSRMSKEIFAIYSKVTALPAAPRGFAAQRVPAVALSASASTKDSV